jgi:hypothetical protein
VRLLGIHQADVGHTEKDAGGLNAGERECRDPCAHRNGEVKVADVDRTAGQSDSDLLRDGAGLIEREIAIERTERPPSEATEEVISQKRSRPAAKLGEDLVRIGCSSRGSAC